MITALSEPFIREGIERYPLNQGTVADGEKLISHTIGFASSSKGLKRA
ncbi:MAG: hypothetical protein ABJ205_04425 [Erythrobacter sp.]